MAYEKLNLKDGEKFSAEHVSHIEDGIVQNAHDLEGKQPVGDYLTPESTIPSEKIVEDSEHRFTSDTEKEGWNSKAEGTHGHEMSDVEGLQNALDGKSDNSHTHDDRYYTETETDELLSGKSDNCHGHVVSDVDGLQSALEGKSDTEHNHVSADISDLESYVDERIGVVAGSALDEINGEVV